MSEEIKINKNNKSITFINNGIAFSQFGIADEILDLITNLQTQLQQKENIIKELREIINQPMINYSSCIKALDEIEIVLDKEDNV